LMPGVWNADDGVLFAGVGSILNNRIPAARLRVVFGSGVGYHAPPTGYHGEGWRIYCVRGPLSAQVLGLPDGLAVCDSAILVPRVITSPPSDQTVVFVPHWSSVAIGQWQRACAMAGIEFLDPRGESRSVIERLATARMVIAESMHAAIIAEAFRRPWIAVRASPTISSFKWQDWCQSLGLDYAPVALPPSGLQEWIEHRCLPAAERYAAPGLGRADDGPALKNAQLLDRYRLSVAAAERTSGRRPSRYARLLPLAVRRAMRATEGTRSVARLDRHLCERAAEALTRQARQPGMLGPDRAMERATDGLLDRLDRLKRDYAAGFPA
jgi:succinoglycan biosynthesis protein ExoV